MMSSKWYCADPTKNAKFTISFQNPGIKKYSNFWLIAWGVAILLTLTPNLTPDFQSSKVKEFEFGVQKL